MEALALTEFMLNLALFEKNYLWRSFKEWVGKLRTAWSRATCSPSQAECCCDTDRSRWWLALVGAGRAALGAQRYLALHWSWEERIVVTANAHQQLSKVPLVTIYRAAFLQEVNPTKPKLMFEAHITTSGRCHFKTSRHVQQSFMKWRDTRRCSMLWLCWIDVDVHSDSARADCARLATRLFWMRCFRSRNPKRVTQSHVFAFKQNVWLENKVII